MSSSPQQTSSPSPRAPFEGLVPHRKQINIGLLVVGAAFVVLPVVLVIRAGGIQNALGPVVVWGVCMALVGLISGLIGFGYTSGGKLTDAETIRVHLLITGGLMGLLTALLGFVLPFTDYKEALSGGMTSWRENPRALIWPCLALVGGLGLMFVSIQLGRGMERQNQSVRRLIYGYNTALMSLLLLAVLAIPNVLAYADPFNRFFSKPFDWTKSTMYTVSPALRNVLSDLKEPVKAYVMLLPNRDPNAFFVAQDVKTLLENCRSISGNFSWEFVDLSPANYDRISGFRQKYAIADQPGVLLVRGSESDTSKGDHVFIRYNDLFSSGGGMRRGESSYAFRGESGLYNAIVELTEGKTVIYFTQGHGELSLEASQPRMPGMPAPPRAGDLGTLKQRLTERKSVEVKPLKVDRTLTKVPDDASVVVVARPNRPFAPEEANVLLEYVKRAGKTETTKDKDGREHQEEKVTAGKLFLLFNPIIQKLGDTAQMAPTGLEGLLGQYNVKLGNNRILNIGANFRDPVQVMALANPRSSNPVARAFVSEASQTNFFFRNVRTVEPAAEDRPGIVVDRLLGVPGQYGFWAETNLDRSPSDLVAMVRSDEKLAIKKLTGEPAWMAVAVSESSGGAPRDMAHAGVNAGKETPRMVVFGSADWINDDGLGDRYGPTRMDLFNSSVSWLRQKASIGTTIPPKERVPYDSNIKPQDEYPLMLLPLGLMILSIIGLGTGVWVVRRR